MPGTLRQLPANWADYVGQFNPNNRAQWAEYVGDDGKRTDTMTLGENLSTLQGFVLSHDWLYPALVYWLGVSWVDYTVPATPVLKRVLPAPHPETNNIFAKRVEIRGWKYKDRVVNINAPNQPDARIPYARYEKYLLTVDFGSVDYAVLPDGTTDPATGQPITEWQRFVSVEPSDSTLIAVVNGGGWLIKNPGSVGFPNGTPDNIMGPRFNRVVERTDLKITAHNLPYDFIFDDFNIPRKLMKGKGRVNAEVAGGFLGFNDQTMLLESFKVRKYPAAVPNATWTVMQFGVDLELNFSYQEPTKAISTETQAGWNLTPGSKGIRWEDGWYGREFGTVGSGITLYSSVRMLNLLTHWSINNVP